MKIILILIVLIKLYLKKNFLIIELFSKSIYNLIWLTFLLIENNLILFVLFLH